MISSKYLKRGQDEMGHAQTLYDEISIISLN